MPKRKGLHIPDDDLLAMQERALRVLSNHSSGSARRMANDVLHMTTLLLSRSRSYRVRVKRREENELFARLEDMFRENH